MEHLQFSLKMSLENDDENANANAQRKDIINKAVITWSMVEIYANIKIIVALCF